MTLVVDASVAVKWFVREDLHDAALGILDLDEELIAPRLIVAEVANALLKKVRGNELSISDAGQAVDELEGGAILLHESAGLVGDALQLGFRINAPVYDGLYVALAVRHDARVVTADRQLVQRCKQHGYAARIALLGGSLWPAS